MMSVDPNTETTTAVVDTPPAAAPAAAEPVAVATSTDAVKAARYEAANAAIEAAAKAETDKAAAAVVAEQAAAAAKAKEADTVGQLTAKLAETEAKAVSLADKAKFAEKLEGVQALVKAGKHYDAIQALSDIGLSFDAAVQQVMNPGQEPTPAKEEEKPAGDPEVAKLKEELAALNKRLADADAREAAAAKEAGRKYVVDHVKTKATDYPYLASNEEWITQALADAEPDYAKAIEANAGQDISPEAKDALVIKALAAAEAKHKAIAEKYLAATKAVIPSKSPNSVPKVAQPTLTFTGSRAGITPSAKTGAKASLDELKRARRSN